MKADLHIHSVISDSSLTAEEIIAQSVRAGINLFSITDHDTVKGQGDIQDMAAKNGIGYIKGVEISAFDKKENVQAHILGYGYKNDRLIEDFCSDVYMRRKASGDNMAEKIIGLGYPITFEDILRYAQGGVIYRAHIMHALYVRGLTDGIYGPLFTEWFGAGGLAHFPFEYLDAREAVVAVRQAGGLAVLAHPASYKNWAIIPGLIDAGLDGLEVYHPGHSNDDIAALLEIANEKGLLVTSGSDFHGMYARNPLPIGHGCIPQI